MSSLENKLREILPHYDEDVENLMIAQIKQAFADEGYLTGQEWYYRFVKELPHHANAEIDDERGYLETKQVLNAAKRAAGVSDGE
jgi:hypothetical protein